MKYKLVEVSASESKYMVLWKIGFIMINMA
jgi:hypothetical protein